MYVLIRELRQPNLKTLKGWKLPHIYNAVSIFETREEAEQYATELNMVAAHYGVLRDFDNGGLKSFTSNLRVGADHLAAVEKQHGIHNHVSAVMLETCRVDYIVRLVLD